MVSIENKLSIDLYTFNFVSRETNAKGKPITFRCFRDFLYYSLTFYKPQQYNVSNGGAKVLELRPLGITLPFWLIWTMLHVKHLPRVCKSEDLQLYVNNRPINSYFALLFGLIWPRPVLYETLLSEIEQGIKKGIVLGIDLAIQPGGIVDHVMFVYGYDSENIYVFDTLQIPNLPYEKLTNDNRFIMKLPKSTIKERLGRWSRIWKVVPRENVTI